MILHKKLCGVCLVAFVFMVVCRAQDEGTPIFDQSPKGMKALEQELIGKVRPLIEDKKLLSRDEVKKLLEEPEGGEVDLLEVGAKNLTGEEVADLARGASLKVGYCYLCERCDDWHLNLAGGYAVAADVVATCEHVINSETKMREGYLIVVDQAGKVHRVKSVVASSRAMDAALLRVEGSELRPVALNGRVKQGAVSYCFSSPLGKVGYFSEGIVNRFYWDDTYEGGDKGELMSARHLRVNFSTNWAPGSSGSAVFDKSGNVIGHVSRIEARGSRGTPPMITFHEGIPAGAVKLLAESANNKELLREMVNIEKTVPIRRPVRENGNKDEAVKEGEGAR